MWNEGLDSTQGREKVKTQPDQSRPMGLWTRDIVPASHVQG